MGRTSLLEIDPELVRDGQLLLHQQCSAWGEDIRRAEGNLLLEYGFERRRPPHDVSGSSRYVLELGATRRLCLWGFGLYYGGGRGIHLARYDFRPRLAYLRNDVWTIAEVQAGLPLRSVSLLQQILRQIACYESWAALRRGPSRQEDLSWQWQELADDLYVLDRLRRQ